ncbi:hypothetical protein F5Y16DRAFT_263772 [Xylariaceae sp. FL0255]|nr:hypothetical protein F5Y16DRAFT_263772 [Xylariaceae sp. FL0255]
MPWKYCGTTCRKDLLVTLLPLLTKLSHGDSYGSGYHRVEMFSVAVTYRLNSLCLCGLRLEISCKVFPFNIIEVVQLEDTDMYSEHDYKNCSRTDGSA